MKKSFNIQYNKWKKTFKTFNNCHVSWDTQGRNLILNLGIEIFYRFLLTY